MNLPPSAKIYLAYPAGALRDTLMSRLLEWGYYNLVMSETLDLRDREAVLAFFERELPDYVFYLSAQPAATKPDPTAPETDTPKTGPEETSPEETNSEDTNTDAPPAPAQWLYDSLRSVTHLADAAYLYDVTKLLCLDASAGLLEDALLPDTPQWPAEQLEELRYASNVTRRATTELLDSYRRQYNCDFISAACSSVYGPGAPSRRGAPIIHALLHSIQQAQLARQPSLRLLGHPQDRHALLHLDDLTDATLYLMTQITQPGLICVGEQQTCSLEELTRLLSEISGYQGRFEFEPPRSLPLISPSTQAASQLEHYAWRASVPLHSGVRSLKSPQDTPGAVH